MEEEAEDGKKGAGRVKNEVENSRREGRRRKGKPKVKEGNEDGRQ